MADIPETGDRHPAIARRVAATADIQVDAALHQATVAVRVVGTVVEAMPAPQAAADIPSAVAVAAGTLVAVVAAGTAAAAIDKPVRLGTSCCKRSERQRRERACLTARLFS